MKLNENIKALREEKGMTQAELAEALFVTPQSVSRWEKGQAYPDIEKLPLLSELFGVSVDELLGVSQASAYSISQKLISAREKAANGIPKDRIEYFELLDKSFGLGEDRFASDLLLLARELFKDGIISAERLNETISKIRTRLYEAPTMHRNRLLSNIVIREEAESLDVWHEFITDDNNLACWHDFLLKRYLANCNEPEWTMQRAEVLFCDISKTVFLMTQKSAPSSLDMFHRRLEGIESCKSAIALINVFSARDDDIFISLRINAECRLATTYMFDNAFVDLCNSLDRLKQLIAVAKARVGKLLCGSSELFKGYETELSIEQFLNDLFEIEFMFCRASESCKNNPKVGEFAEFIQSVRASVDPFCGMPYADIKEFKSLLEILNKAITARKQENKELRYYFALKTKRGVILEDNVDAFDEKNILRFIETLKSSGDTQITHIVGRLVDKGNNSCLELPSHRFREMLCDLDKRNLDARTLVNGSLCYIFKTFRQSLSPNTVIKYEEK